MKHEKKVQKMPLDDLVELIDLRTEARFIKLEQQVKWLMENAIARIPNEGG